MVPSVMGINPGGGPIIMADLILAAVESDKERLRDILAGDAYQSRTDLGEEGRSWLARMLGKLWDAFVSLFPAGAVPGSAAYILFWLLALLCAGLLVYGIVRLIRRYSHEWRTGRQTVLTSAELKQTFGDYLRQAEAAGREQNYREGIRLAFLGLLFYADARGWLKVEKWKANGEYLMELRVKCPGLVPLFRESSLLFEQVYYGGSMAGEQDYTALYSRVMLAASKEGYHGEAS